MKFIPALFSVCLFVNTALANDQMRQWTFESGEKQAAEIVAFDEGTRIVTLRKDDQAILKLAEGLADEMQERFVAILPEIEANVLTIRCGYSWVAPPAEPCAPTATPCKSNGLGPASSPAADGSAPTTPTAKSTRL